MPPNIDLVRNAIEQEPYITDIFKHNTNMAKNALFVIYELKNLGLIMFC